MKYSIKLVESDAEIKKMMLSALLEDVNLTINKALPKITKQIQELLYNSIRVSPEYQSLLNGKLRYEFGLVDSISRVQNIIDTWISNITVITKPLKITNAGLSGGFSIGMVASDLQDVLSLSDAQMIDDVRGYSLPWLKWLLLEGNKVLIKDYKVVLGPNKASRTGYAIMRSDESSVWRVPPEFAGTVKNNWITRVIDSLSNEIFTIIQTEIEKAVV